MDKQTEKQTAPPRRGKNPLYEFLTSMKVGVTLLLIVTAACILGTLIPQNQPKEVYLKHYGDVFGRLFLRWGLTNTFSSGWFNALVGLLGLSMLMCSWRRLKTLLRASHPQVTVPLARVESMKVHARVVANLPLQQTAARLAGWLQSKGYKVLQEDASEATCLFARKGRISEWGTFLAHLALLVIILGAMYGNLRTIPGLWRTRAYSAEASLHENEQFTVKLPKDKPFQVELLKAHREMGHGGAVKDYRSEVRIWEDGKSVKTGLIRMNGPVYYQGVSMTMSQYLEPNPSMRLVVEAPHNLAQRIRIPLIGGAQGMSVDMMSTVTHLRANGWIIFAHDVLGVALDKEGKVAMAPGGRPRAPQAGEEVVPALSVYAVENPSRDGMKNWKKVGYVGPAPVDYKGVRFSLEQGNDNTGAVLSLRKDPGVPIVYTGFGLLMLGVMLAFYVSQRTVRIRVWQEKGKAQAAIGVRSRGGLAWAETELERLRAALKSQLGDSH